MKTAQKFARLTPNTFLQHFIHYDNTVSSIIVIRFCAAVYSLEYIFPETSQKRWKSLASGCKKGGDGRKEIVSLCSVVFSYYIQIKTNASEKLN